MEHFDDPSPTALADLLPALADLLPALAAEGLLPALLAAETLLAEQLAKGRRGEWRGLETANLHAHLVDHLYECRVEADATDPETGHPPGVHVAARALMVCARALEARR